MPDLLTRPIKDIVTEDFRTAAVFERYGIDFCCKGNRALGMASADKGISADEIVRALEAVSVSADAKAPRFGDWELDFLADYIVANHHTFVRAAVPNLLAHVNKVAAVHGGNHPQTLKIRDIFTKTGADLLQHMDKEEMMLFPMIRRLAAAKRTGSPAPMGMVNGPISVMMSEHETAGEELEMIRTLTQDYTLPPDACTTYTITYKELAEFEQDLHRHVHLENALLFPGAIALDRIH